MSRTAEVPIHAGANGRTGTSTIDVYHFQHLYTSEVGVRTNIDIDDELLAEAQSLSGSATKKETVRRALELLVQLRRQSGVRELRGRLRWEGDLEDQRTDA